jgi:hypothetical protein
MRLDGCIGEVKRVGDLRVAEAQRDEREHLELSLRQRVETIERLRGSDQAISPGGNGTARGSIRLLT